MKHALTAPASAAQTLARAKWRAGHLVDSALAGATPHSVALGIMAGRIGRAHDAALLGALVIGALCDRGHADMAEEVTQALAARASEHQAARKASAQRFYAERTAHAQGVASND